MKKHELCASVMGSRHRDNVEAIIAWPAFRDLGRPDSVRIEYDSIEAAGWEKRLAEVAGEGFAIWDAVDAQIHYLVRNELVTFAYPHGLNDAHDGIAVVEKLSFGVVELGTVFLQAWGVEGANYRRWGFGRSMIDHGWGCAFRGAGHDRLMSRRWLDFGPWRVIRRPNDTTFIQFHDLAITDPAEAYEQAKVGHQRMGIDPTGGYIQGIALDVIAKVKGLYRAEDRTLEIVVAPGLEVRQQDMRVACGLRLHHRLTSPPVERIDRIAYVFAEKADAQAHLHELWLRELECWYLDERGKHRLDADYRPTPQPPAWVKAVEARGD